VQKREREPKQSEEKQRKHERRKESKIEIKKGVIFMFLHGPFDVPADFMRAEAKGTEPKQEQ